MNLIITDSFDQSCKVSAQKIIDCVKRKPNAKLGLATGGTCENVYVEMVRQYKEGLVSFASVKTVNLDEYIGLEPTHPMSYRKYMDDWFFNHVDVPKENTFVAGGTGDESKAIEAFNHALYDGGYIDIQLLGIGVSGHIGFNEPRDNLFAGAHTEELEESTIEANARYFDSPADVPRRAMTMGIGDILKAEEIVLVATGESKVPAMKALLTNDFVTTAVPATVLKLHRNVTIVIDRALADLVGVSE